MRNIALLALLTLGGCSAQEQQENGPTYPQGELIGTTGASRLYVFNDMEAGNVCYYTETDYPNVALSCVPARYER